MEWGESSADYLRRSTWIRARETRRFLNEALSALPSDARARLCADLWRDTWGSPLSEVVVGLALRGLGGDLRYEPSLPSGKRLDWEATWPDGTVYVEVATPVINESSIEQFERNEALAAIVRKAVPPGWRVYLMQVPAAGPNDPKSPLKKALAQAFGALPTEPPPGYQRDVEVPLRAGILEMRIMPARPGGGPPIEIYPAVAHFDNAHARIDDMVRDKRDQSRGAPHPVLIAIRGALGTHLEAYDIGLYGRTVAMVAPGVGQYATRFDPTGVLATTGMGAPTISGVLAFPEIGVARSSEPVLYLHQRFSGTLPAALMTLERRVFDAERVTSIPAERTAFAEVTWAERD